ncbi:MAG: hypothetical protein ACP5US_12555 [Candidatus Kryptoniota bacterium]
MKFINVLLVITGLALTADAQLRVSSVDVGPSYNVGRLLKSTFQSVIGPGTEADVRMQLNRTWSLTISLGYADLKLDQNNPVGNWNWGFYIAPYSGLVTSILKDTTYKAVFQPNQHLYLVPIGAVLMAEIPAIKGIHLYAGAGGTLQLYQRHLWVHEYWSKYYPSYNYTFSYDYNNDAGLKVGTMYAIKALIQLECPFSTKLGGTLQFSLVDYLAAQNELSYSNFPMKVLASGTLGLRFYY